MAQKKQETALTGLSDKEVLISREKYGNNLLTPPKRPSMWKEERMIAMNNWHLLFLFGK